jgi:hypothetical protein
MFVAPAVVAQDLPENDPDAEFGLVYFLRPNYTIPDGAYIAIIDEERVCKLNDGRYSAHRVAPGEHTFKAQRSGKKGKKKAEVTQIEIEAGKTYYIYMVVQSENWWPDISAREITRNAALRSVEKEKLKPDPDCGKTDYNL